MEQKSKFKFQIYSQNYSIAIILYIFCAFVSFINSKQYLNHKNKKNQQKNFKFALIIIHIIQILCLIYLILTNFDKVIFVKPRRIFITICSLFLISHVINLIMIIQSNSYYQYKIIQYWNIVNVIILVIVGIILVVFAFSILIFFIIGLTKFKQKLAIFIGNEYEEDDEIYEEDDEVYEEDNEVYEEDND